MKSRSPLWRPKKRKRPPKHRRLKVMQNAHTRFVRMWALRFLLVLGCVPLCAACGSAGARGGNAGLGVEAEHRQGIGEEAVQPDAAVEVGTLLLACRPVGCTLTLDERRVREVGAESVPMPLPAGEYRALLSAPGYLTVRETLFIEAGAVTEWAVELWPLIDGVDNDE